MDTTLPKAHQSPEGWDIQQVTLLLVYKTKMNGWQAHKLKTSNDTSMAADSAVTSKIFQTRMTLSTTHTSTKAVYVAKLLLLFKHRLTHISMQSTALCPTNHNPNPTLTPM